MARKQTLEIAQNEGVDRLIVSLVSRVAVLAPPWIVGVLMFIMGAISHAKWGAPPAVTWATMAGTLSTTGLTALTFAVSHDRRGALGRPLSTATTAAAGLWFTVATITGVMQQFTFGLLFFGGVSLAIGWNIRAVVRAAGPGESGHVDPMGWLFDKSKDTFGLKGARVRTREVTDHKVKGQMQLPAGERVAGDVIKRTPYIESGLHFPPGSVLVAPDADDASKAHVTITDPRIMNRPIPWPGPSRPGGSIAEPLRIGLFQDSEPVEPILPGNHLQFMGASGSGKSLGGTWNVGAEIITRSDTAFFGIDLAKDEQTFRPFRPAMHGIHVTKARAITFIQALHEEIPKRTKWLSDRGYTEWEPGCGLLYWVVVFEEVPKIFDVVGSKNEELIEQIAKEIRSAGGHVVMSLQKATYTEMPTVVRSQMAFMCFGLNSSSDREYGLSEAQQRTEADPSQWGAGKPEHVGKAFIDCKGIPETHIAMPLRTYAFGETPRAAAAALAAHAAQWPASTKPMDEFTVRLAALDPEAPRPGQPIPMPAASPTPAATAVLDRPTGDGRGDDDEPREDETALELLATAAELVIASQFVSTEMLQRKLRLPHEDCLRLLEALERKGIIGPDPGDPDVKRTVLVSTEDIAGGSTAIDDLREDGDAVSEYQRTADPDPSITAGPNDEIREPTLKEDPSHIQKSGRKLPPAEARGLVYEWIRQQAAVGRTAFTAGNEELTQIRERAGMTSRGWTYKVLEKLANAGALERTDRGFEIVSIEALDAVERDGGSGS